MKRLALVASLLAAGSARAAGTVSGVVRADPRPKPPPAAPIVKDAAVCGRQAAADRLVIAADGALANVVVSVRGVKPAQPPPPTPGAAVDQVGCRYSPHVQAVTVGTTVALLNNDAVLHNVHGTVEASAAPVTVFNVAMPFKGQKLPTVLRKPGVIKLRCDAGHTWMSAYIHVFDHPYFAVTDARGRFVLEGLPPGRYTLEYWHEPLLDEGKPVVKTATVEVAPGQDATADAKLAL